MKPRLTVLVGLQGSGKSTWALNNKEKFKYIILSSDEYRKEHPTWTNEDVFKNLYADMNRLLKDNQNVVIDATNITYKSRKKIFDNLKVDCDIHCLIFNTPIEECRKRVEARNNEMFNTHHVPLDVLERYYQSFEIPFREEGFDVIMIDRLIPTDKSISYRDNLLIKCNGFDQHNKHHTQNLGDHLTTVSRFLHQHSSYSTLAYAGLLHDIGKLYTQFYKPNDENAHYYNHANVGAYELMCNLYDGVNFDLDFLFYVNYHMKSHDWQTDKAKQKWKRIFGDEKFYNLLVFNVADKYRP